MRAIPLVISFRRNLVTLVPVRANLKAFHERIFIKRERNESLPLVLLRASRGKDCVRTARFSTWKDYIVDGRMILWRVKIAYQYLVVNNFIQPILNWPLDDINEMIMSN